ncbi:pantoate--beta-alanine ligase [Gammaproteobacteria bacterium]|nr:pantoate--beta-alanine ligase [Gammaproteobacteria bacterium]
MKLIQTKAELNTIVSALKLDGKSIGFVPTMGALHEGHLQLVRKAVSQNDITIVSIFVNPTQFNNKQDLASYPRTIDADAELLASVGCSYVFAPDAQEFYSKEEMDSTFEFNFAGLDTVMEGKFRPGHFNGVVQVVSKLFKLVQAQRAYFGEKDFQQLAIIRHMVKEMHFDIEIVGCPVERAESGLALSSRNALLSSDERKLAASIYQVLDGSRAFAFETGVTDTQKAVVNAINQHDGLEVEYFDIVDGHTLQTVHFWEDSDYIVGCITVYCGKVRLIDHIDFKTPNEK